MVFGRRAVYFCRATLSGHLPCSSATHEPRPRNRRPASRRRRATWHAPAANGSSPNRCHQSRSGSSWQRRWTYVREGDKLIVTRLDRLARSMGDLLEIAERLRAKGVALQVLDPAMDTSTAAGELIFHVFGAVGQLRAQADAGAPA